MTILSTRRLLAAVLLGVALVLAACGDDSDGSTGATDGASNPDPSGDAVSADPGGDGDVGPATSSGDAGALVTLLPVGEELELFEAVGGDERAVELAAARVREVEHLGGRIDDEAKRLDEGLVCC